MKKLFFLFIASFLLIPGFLLAQGQEITLKDIFSSRKFFPKGMYGLIPLKDGNTYSRHESDSINVYNYEAGDYIKTLAIGKEMIPEGDTTPIELSSYTFSKDESKLLIPTATENIYRYSTVSEYYIWDISAKKLRRLSTGGKQRLATFSPDGNKVAFVRDNNLIVTDLVNKIETQVTSDGKQNGIINGTTDWVYEEEFAITQGFEWSPDGKKIAFYRFDESKCPRIYNDRMG